MVDTRRGRGGAEANGGVNVGETASDVRDGDREGNGGEVTSVEYDAWRDGNGGAGGRLVFACAY